MKKLDMEKSDIRRPDTERMEIRRPIEGPERLERSTGSVNRPDRSERKVARTNPRFIANLVVGLVIIASLAFAGYFYYKLHKIERNTNGEAAKQEAQDLLGKVAKIYLIPTGEDPTIATVSDPLALKNQAFFADSQKGDKVLIFTKAGRAVLYRPSIDKIIETAPINIDATKQNATPPQTTTGSTKDKTTF